MRWPWLYIHLHDHEELNTNTSILADLQGPNLRIGEIKASKLYRGSEKVQKVTTRCMAETNGHRWMPKSNYALSDSTNYNTNTY